MSDETEEIWLDGKYVGYRLVTRPQPTVVTTTRMTRGAFIDRFPTEKHTQLLELAKTDPILAAAKHKLDIRDYVDVTDPQTIMFIEYMKITNVLTASEGDALLEPIDVTHIGAII